jgi:hypothetical protein
MANTQRNLLWIPIVLALLGWVFAYLSPLYHEGRKKPKLTAEYEEVDFIHFIATRFEIANTGNAEAKEVQCILPRFIFPGGGTPCTTAIRDISPHHIRFTVDELSDKRIFTIFHIAPKESFNFTVYKGCFDDVLDYYRLNPSVSYERLLDGVRIRTSYGDIELVEKEVEKSKRRRSSGKKPS